MTPLAPRRRRAVLLTVCVAVFAINLDTTVVNVALPDLVRQLHASTGTLQWVVDGYNLAFAGLVLACGALGDRVGRRPALVVGLLGFAATGAGAALAGSAPALVGWRFAMGGFAALIYPTTLSVIANAFPERGARARAVGLWGAVTGLGVAVGPVTGGLLLAHFAWPSVFWALVPVAVLAAALAVALVPESRAEAPPPIDWVGLAVSTAAVGLLVDTVIEAPAVGWGAARSLAGFAGAAVLAVGFVAVERRRRHPLVDVALFRVPAFSAASGAVTVAFFALAGFIFLVTQYMQFVRGWGTLSTGVRILPVAASIGVGSVVGTRLAGRLGHRAVVAAGLIGFGAAFFWVGSSPTAEPYGRIALQMVLMGLGLGATTAPATESILSVLPPARAGVGSAVNDAARETGATLGVAVIGSVFSSLYLRHLAASAVVRAMPRPAAAATRRSVGAALVVAQRAPAALRPLVTRAVNDAFMGGFHVACLVGAAVCLLGALGATRLPGPRPQGAPVPALRPAESDDVVGVLGPLQPHQLALALVQGAEAPSQALVEGPP